MKAQKLDIGIRASHTNWYCYPRNFGLLCNKKVYIYFLIDVGIFWDSSINLCVKPVSQYPIFVPSRYPDRGPFLSQELKMKKEPPPGFELWSLRLAGCRATISSDSDFQTAPHQLHCLNLNEESWFFKRMFWESSMIWNFLVWRILINLFNQNKFDFWKFQSQECPKLIRLQPKILETIQDSQNPNSRFANFEKSIPRRKETNEEKRKIWNQNEPTYSDFIKMLLWFKTINFVFHVVKFKRVGFPSNSSVSRATILISFVPFFNFVLFS